MVTKKLIQIDSVSKYFNLQSKNNSRSGGQMDGFQAFTSTANPVLKDITLDIDQGEWIGIIGKNGSGKSTLLKLLAGIHTPDKGQVKVSGSVLPFFGPDEILHPEGRAEDAVLVKALQVGLPREDIAKIYNNIINFSELHDFTSQKIKFLSTGMKTRLILGLILNINADIYLFDEIPATTDATFQVKVNNRLQRLKQMGKTAIIVSHNMDEVKQHCNKCILLHKGELVAYDDTNTILKLYNQM
ncbi:MAG: ABC transporter ATP-binding protein [Minisyncoccia bacterium]